MCNASDSFDRLGKLLKLAGFVRAKLWLSFGMDEKSKWQCTVPVWLITRLPICPQIWNVPAWSTVVIYTPYLSCLETFRGKWTARSFRCHCSASLCFSIMWLLMNLSGESYAITQQAWQCAPDSYIYYITMYKNNKLRHQHPSHVRLIRKIIFPPCDLFLPHVVAQQ